MKPQRGLYLAYYLKQLDQKTFNRFLDYVSSRNGISKSKLVRDIIKSVFTYNISILEYFQFHFFELDDRERNKWAGTGFMYEYQLLMNPKESRKILDDKTLFHKYYGDFFIHSVADLSELRQDPQKAELILNNPSGKIVFKQANGKCGAQVEIRESDGFDRFGLIKYMETHQYDLVEEGISQHQKLNSLSPSAVNTIRVITQLDDKNKVNILGCRLRISVDSPVDNMAAGNLAAPIDEDTGLVVGPAVYSDITKADEVTHPITKKKIVGFQVPFWNETITMVKQAALLHPQNKSIGWDVVITDKGPGLIEGNHDWCKLLWQLPVKKGLKSELQKYEKVLA